MLYDFCDASLFTYITYIRLSYETIFSDFFTDENMPDPTKSWTIYNYTYVYSIGNPAVFYNDIDVVVGQNGIGGVTDATGVSNVIIRDIDSKICS